MKKISEEVKFMNTPEFQIHMVDAFNSMVDDHKKEFKIVQDRCEIRFQDIQKSVAENTEITHGNSVQIEEVRQYVKSGFEPLNDIKEMVYAAKGGFRVLEWLGGIAKWVGVIAGAAGAVYTAYQIFIHGGTPK